MNLDIFNRKRVAELEAGLRDLEKVRDENSELKSMLVKAEHELKLVLTLKDAIPEGCTPGLYCEACEFAKKYYYHSWGYRANRNTMITGTICGKGESCQHFIQKEIKE